MNINLRQSQFELFPKTSGNSSKGPKSPYLFSSLTLSLENIIILSIFLVMIMVFAFSLGVERGKNVAQGKKTEETHGVAIAATDNETILSDTATVVNASIVQNFMPKENIVAIEKAASFPEERLENNFTIQVASFKTQKYAKKEVVMLKNGEYSDFDIYVVSKGKYSIVCVGAFNRKNEAEVLLSKLRKKYKDCIVRRL